MPPPLKDPRAPNPLETQFGFDEDRDDVVRDVGDVGEPQQLASTALARIQREARIGGQNRPLRPLVDSGLRFEAVKVLTPGLHRLICEAWGSPSARVNLPAANSFVNLRSYTLILNRLALPFPLIEPITDQQPDETYDEFALFKAYLLQASIKPWAEGERRIRTTERLFSIFHSQHEGQAHGYASVPLTHLNALAKAWSWDHRATTRDLLVTLGDDEASSVLLARQTREIKAEKNRLVLSTIRAATQCVESGDPKTAKNYLQAFSMLFGHGGVGDFIKDITDEAVPEDDRPLVTLHTPSGSGKGGSKGRVAVGLEWGSPDETSTEIEAETVG